MQELSQYFIGILVLLMGWPIGNILASKTREELKSGQIWFKLIIVLCLIGSVIFAFLESDVLFFSFLFIAVVTSRSLLK